MLDTEWTEGAVRARHEEKRKDDEIAWKRFKRFAIVAGLIFASLFIIIPLTDKIPM